MARKSEGRTFNVSVIGLSGVEKEKGQWGVGKSCLCNRFFNQVADSYYQEHISVLSQSDFAGRVINNDHFLYWGSTTKLDEGSNFTFHVIEQTEFIDDVSFSPFKSARTEAYVKRAVGGKVQSAEKLMYLCKDQLGMETDSAYPQVLMPEGKLTIDGFLCCFDVSKVPQRSIEKQVEFVAALINNALKTKKPVIVATTKGDTSCQEYVKEAEKLTTRKEFKGSVPLVETSAHENINIEAAFLLLAHLMDKTKARTKILPFLDARKQRNEILAVAKDAYLSLLRVNIRDPKAVWNTWKKRLESESDFAHYVEIFGTDQARKEFRVHTKRLRDEQVRVKEHRYLDKLPVLLKHMLPDLDHMPERSWNQIRRLICEHSEFSSNFVVVDEDDPASSWKHADSFLYNTEETRIPFDLLTSAEAEACFRNHLNELQAAYRKRELQLQFKAVLAENPQVCPGKPLSETYVFFLGKECYSSLDEFERNQVYEQYLAELRATARAQFQELLWEMPGVFREWKPRQDLTNITAALQDDPRYKSLSRLKEDREVAILSHLGFIQSPSPSKCSFAHFCVDNMVEGTMGERAISPELKSSSDSLDVVGGSTAALNLVLLGRDGLATALNREIRKLCPEDEYKQDHMTYCLDYRPIEGDVSREQNALATASFKPHGCLCVFNSEVTLTYVRDSLERSLAQEVMREGEPTLGAMPILLVQAHNSSHSEGERGSLADRARTLAQRLNGEFIGEGSAPPEGSVFLESQIICGLRTLVRGCSPGLHGWELSDAFQPDIRLSMCLMCGDPFPLELALGPLLNSDTCRVLADTPYCITLDFMVEGTKQKVEIEVASYHGGERLHQGMFHGHILAYSDRRRASLASLRAYSECLPPVPKCVLCISDLVGVQEQSTFFSSDVSQELIDEGSNIAHSMGASFIKSTPDFSQQTSVFHPFFTWVWHQRDQLERLFADPSDDPCPQSYDEKAYYATRPPAPLPKACTTYNTHKSSTSNSTDSEPVYDQPNLYHSHYSDSDHDRGSSVSPPPQGEEIYSEPIITNGEHLVKPSYVKARKNIYAGWPDKNSGKVEALSSNQASSRSSTDLHTHNEAESATRRAAMTSRSQSQGASMFRQQLVHVEAPLAKAEPIEIADYCHVKDAVPLLPQGDNDYQMVEDALPPGMLHRIRSTKSPCRVKGHTDSESECSSLEREAIPKRRSAPHRRKPKVFNRDKYKLHHDDIDGPIYSTPMPSGAKPGGTRHSSYTGRDNMAHSPSEDGCSDGTGDEIKAIAKKTKKRRSFHNRKWRTPKPTPVNNRGGSRGGSSPSIGGSREQLIGSPLMNSSYDDMSFYNPVVHHFQTLPKNMGHSSIPGEDVEDDNVNSRKTWFPTMRDPDKQRKKEERRRQKEEDKKAKEAHKRTKKASGKHGGPPTLEDFPCAPTMPGIPHFVLKCVAHIEAEGLKTEGIYRIPGNKVQVDLFLSKYNEDPQVDIPSLEIPVFPIATVLKSFFSDLNEALVPSALCDELMEAQEMTSKSSRLLMLRGVIKKLPHQNLEVLKFVISHLYKVSQHSGSNSMGSVNLAKCWWPTLIRLQFKTYERLVQCSQVPEDIVCTLIEQCSFFFYGGNEV